MAASGGAQALNVFAKGHVGTAGDCTVGLQDVCALGLSQQFNSRPQVVAGPSSGLAMQDSFASTCSSVSESFITHLGRSSFSSPLDYTSTPQSYLHNSGLHAYGGGQEPLFGTLGAAGITQLQQQHSSGNDSFVMQQALACMSSGGSFTAGDGRNQALALAATAAADDQKLLALQCALLEQQLAQEKQRAEEQAQRQMQLQLQLLILQQRQLQQQQQQQQLQPATQAALLLGLSDAGNGVAAGTPASSFGSASTGGTGSMLHSFGTGLSRIGSLSADNSFSGSFEGMNLFANGEGPAPNSSAGDAVVMPELLTSQQQQQQRVAPGPIDSSVPVMGSTGAGTCSIMATPRGSVSTHPSSSHNSDAALGTGSAGVEGMKRSTSGFSSSSLSSQLGTGVFIRRRSSSGEPAAPAAAARTTVSTGVGTTVGCRIAAAALCAATDAGATSCSMRFSSPHATKAGGAAGPAATSAGHGASSVGPSQQQCEPAALTPGAGLPAVKCSSGSNQHPPSNFIHNSGHNGRSSHREDVGNNAVTVSRITSCSSSNSTSTGAVSSSRCSDHRAAGVVGCGTVPPPAPPSAAAAPARWAPRWANAPRGDWNPKPSVQQAVQGEGGRKGTGAVIPGCATVGTGFFMPPSVRQALDAAAAEGK